MFLLIPNRIREIKEEGRAEGRKEALAEARAKRLAEARAKGREEGRAEGREEGRAEALAKARAKRRENGLNEDVEGLLKAAIKAGREIGIERERERFSGLLARYDRGEITLDELRATFFNRRNGDGGAD